MRRIEEWERRVTNVILGTRLKQDDINIRCFWEFFQGFIDFFEKCNRCFSKQDISPFFCLNYVIGFLGYLCFIYEACGINSLKLDWAGRRRCVEGQSVRMSVRWETEGLQTVGIVCLVIMFLKLMHLLGLIDITETGERKREKLANNIPGVA